MGDSLINSAKYNRVERLEQLIAEGVELDEKDRYGDGRTALHYAAMYGCPEATALLLTGGVSVKADVNMLCDNGLTPLRYLIQWGMNNVSMHTKMNVCVAAVLLQHGADPGRDQEVNSMYANGRFRSGRSETSCLTLLMDKVSRNCSFMEVAQVFTLLIQNGAAIDQRVHGDINYFVDSRSMRDNVDGCTALMLAVENKNDRLMLLCLDAGADMHIATANGITPLELCKLKGFDNGIRILTDWQEFDRMEHKEHVFMMSIHKKSPLSVVYGLDQLAMGRILHYSRVGRAQRNNEKRVRADNIKAELVSSLELGWGQHG